MNYSLHSEYLTEDNCYQQGWNARKAGLANCPGSDVAFPDAYRAGWRNCHYRTAEAGFRRLKEERNGS